ncbi:MBL fold metallo-hydrolase [Candidatus Woesearchaeota archaeon]|nr:MBL fold metallo-hydrolase [Candidatus Woesearchaeota archaeon]MBW3018139.1 MBL fold metallo-hydrolase [Candidatus Woesearchaeota archaeon]
MEIKRLNHDCFKIKTEDGKIIYTDPYKIKKDETADLILITHDHFDHCSPDDVKKVAGEKTIIVTNNSCKSKLGAECKKIQKIVAIEPGESCDADGIKIKAVHSYNVNKFKSPGNPFHPKGFGIGFIFTAEGKNIYLAGDTDAIPDMKKLGDIDIALLPVSGTYVMTAEEAADACNNMIKPKKAIPMHYGDIVGSSRDAEKFCELVSCETEIVD